MKADELLILQAFPSRLVWFFQLLDILQPRRFSSIELNVFRRALESLHLLVPSPEYTSETNARYGFLDNQLRP